MTASGNMTSAMVKVFITTRLADGMKVSGNATRNMAKELSISAKAAASKASGRMAKRQGKGSYFIRMGLLKFSVIESNVFFQVGKTPMKL